MRQASIGFYLLFIVSAFTQTTNTRNLVVGLPMLWPYATQREGGVSGMYVDLLQAVFRHIGEKCVIRVMPLARSILEFMSGALDVTVMANNKPTLSKGAHLTKEFLSYDRLALLRRAHSPLNANAAALPINASIAVVRGFSPESTHLEKRDVTLVNYRERRFKILKGASKFNSGNIF